jgi:succinate dehydrogenase/fumarate reductase cytochrome b subunit
MYTFHEAAYRSNGMIIAILLWICLLHHMCFGITITYLNLIQEEIKRRSNSDNARHHSFHNLLSSRLLSKNIKIRICKTIILSVNR